jgi:hypothetical protein
VTDIKHQALKAVPVIKNGKPVWTQHKLWSEMRAGGWQSQGQGVWTHPDCPGYRLQLFALDSVARRELWHRYAEANEVPRPEDFR